MTSRDIRSACLGLVVVLGTFLPLAASHAQSGEPIAASRFAITVDGVEIAVFGELVTIRSGSDDILELNAGRLMLPRSRTLPIVVLRRGQTADMSMWAWHEAARVGSPGARKDATIVIYDVEGKPVARYYLENAWPSKIEVGALKAGASSVLMETITMTCEFIQRVAV